MFTHLTFDGNCEEAFAVYARLLGGTVTFTLRYRDSPMAGNVPPAWADKIVHTTLTLPGGGRVYGNDAPPGSYEPGRGFSLTTTRPTSTRRAPSSTPWPTAAVSPSRSQRRSGRWRSGRWSIASA